MANERRTDSEMRRLFEAIERVGKDCQDQHEETQKTLNDIVNTQTVFAVKVQGMETTLDRIGTKVDSTSEKVAATDATVGSLRKQNAEQYGRLSDIEGNMKLLDQKGGPVSFIQTDNFKWLIGAGVFVSLLVLLAFGALTVQEVRELSGQ